jgi:hypothetical protein
MRLPDPITIEGRCNARTRKGTPCTFQAGWGTGHQGTGRCKLHGGASPQAELSGAVTLARREMLVMGRPLDMEPHEALLECIRIAAGEVAYASERIAELDAADAVGPVVSTHRRPLKEEKGAEDPRTEVEEVRVEAPALHIWIVVRQHAMDRLVNYSKIALAAGVAERQVRLAEQQGQLLVEVIRGVLTDLGVNEHPEAPAVVRKHLTLIAGRAA